ncbi:unnamed protein product, partial [Amoebophrya sp. A25]
QDWHRARQAGGGAVQVLETTAATSTAPAATIGLGTSATTLKTSLKSSLIAPSSSMPGGRKAVDKSLPAKSITPPTVDHFFPSTEQPPPIADAEKRKDERSPTEYSSTDSDEEVLDSDDDPMSRMLKPPKKKVEKVPIVLPPPRLVPSFHV